MLGVGAGKRLAEKPADTTAVEAKARCKLFGPIHALRVDLDRLVPGQPEQLLEAAVDHRLEERPSRRVDAEQQKRRQRYARAGAAGGVVRKLLEEGVEARRRVVGFPQTLEQLRGLRGTCRAPLEKRVVRPPGSEVVWALG